MWVGPIQSVAKTGFLEKKEFCRTVIEILPEFLACWMALQNLGLKLQLQCLLEFLNLWILDLPAIQLCELILQNKSLLVYTYILFILVFCQTLIKTFSLL